ncbi:MAG TPA: D-alanyl-D-alanine carboxypeptidase, partial [Pyrinomonadaceae bacterium]|nr:D-alanyl-D-alanine carboxypeptidase [Pyrinomonadaceae bacterium]
MFRRIAVLSLVLSGATLPWVVAQDTRPRTSTPVVPAATPTPQPMDGSSVRNSTTRAAANEPRTLAELLIRIEQIVHQPALESGFFAIKIFSLDTGNVIYEQNANKFVRPASNMKLYTVAAAFDRLTPEYHFITSVYAREKPDDGKVKGDLIIYGRGDPSIAARFNNGDYFKGINELADRIVAAGVKRVKGDLVGDESYFNGDPLGSG